MHRDRPRLTRDQLVTIISDFYIFITKLHIPSSALKFPPEDGWPNITLETTKNCGKSPIVIDLIKHLPYIDDTMAFEEMYDIHYKSDVVDYSIYTPEMFKPDCFEYGEMGLQYCFEEFERRKAEEHVEEEEDDEEEDEDDNDEEEDSDIQEEDDNGIQGEEANDSGVDEMWDEEEDWWNGDDPDELVMPNMIVLAQGHESGGRNIVLDVFKGTIHEDIIRCIQVSPVTVEEFFEDLRKQWEKLNLVPCLGEIHEVGSDYEGDDVKPFIDTYREHGWPGEGFRKEEALAAIMECKRQLEEREDREREERDLKRIEELERLKLEEDASVALTSLIQQGDS